MPKLARILITSGILALALMVAKPALAADVIIEHPDPGTTASANESVYGSVSEAPTSVVVKYQTGGGSWNTACNANIDALTWDCVWNTATLASGSYTLRADATIGGVVSSSGTVTITVSNAASGSVATPTPAASSSSSTKTKTSASPRASASASVSPSTTPVATTTDDTAKSSNTMTYVLIAVGVVVVGGGVTYFILKGKKKPPVA